jgi:hypothetical protein
MRSLDIPSIYEDNNVGGVATLGGLRLEESRRKL